ncbi:chorismate mutase, partial [Clostridium botulinum]
MQSIRGAITIEKNEVKYIKEASIKLFSEILIRNNLNRDDIVSIFIS